eukprot:g15009.t1
MSWLRKTHKLEAWRQLPIFTSAQAYRWEVTRTGHSLPLVNYITPLRRTGAFAGAALFLASFTLSLMFGGGDHGHGHDDHDSHGAHGGHGHGEAQGHKGH